MKFEGKVIKYGDNATKMQTLPADEFPYVTVDKGEDFVEIKEATKVYFSYTDSNGKEIRASFTAEPFGSAPAEETPEKPEGTPQEPSQQTPEQPAPSAGINPAVIGIGAGGGVDGQVLVVTDMLGMTNDFSPRFLRRYAGKSGTIRYSGYNSVDAVTGATATSRAVTDGVNRALAIVADLGEEHMLEFEETETE